MATSASPLVHGRSRARTRSATALGALPLYALAIAAAEVLAALRDPVAAAVVDGLLVFALVNHWALTAPTDAQSARERARTIRDVLPALAVIPLMRLVSLAMPLGNLAAVDRLLILGACLLLSTLLTARLLHLTPAQLGLEVGPWPRQAAIAAAGVPLGLVAYLLLTRPR